MKKELPIVPCPYCDGLPAELVLNSAFLYKGRNYGPVWFCRGCGAYVGTHANSKDHKPLGRLANAELRSWKAKAHAAFDPLWRSGVVTRPEAYGVLRQLMGKTEKDGHIGMFDVDECKLLIRELKARGLASTNQRR